MKIKLRTTMAGPGGTYLAGTVVDLPDAQAVDLLNGGYAEAVSTASVETATVKPEKSAVAPPANPAEPPKKISIGKIYQLCEEAGVKPEELRIASKKPTFDEVVAAIEIAKQSRSA